MALVVERSNVILAGGDVRFQVVRGGGSGTFTVRSRALAYAVLVVKIPP